jgi:hypothetical protein
MNFIFGIIILAMFILALRVIWATGMQLLAMLKSGMAAINHYLAQRAANRRVPVIMPQIRHEVDWEVMADTVRKEIQQRNSGLNRETERLDVVLQVKTKTMELIKADIQIAKLELELQKIRPAQAEPVANSGKKRKRTKVVESVDTDDLSSRTPHPVHQLRSALKTGGLNATVANDSARH